MQDNYEHMCVPDSEASIYSEEIVVVYVAFFDRMSRVCSYIRMSECAHTAHISLAFTGIPYPEEIVHVQ